MRVWISLAFVAVACFAAVWDVYAVGSGRPANTVSATLYDWSLTWPILPFAVGVLVGHVFWPHVIRVSVAPVPVPTP